MNVCVCACVCDFFLSNTSRLSLAQKEISPPHLEPNLPFQSSHFSLTKGLLKNSPLSLCPLHPLISVLPALHSSRPYPSLPSKGPSLAAPASGDPLFGLCPALMERPALGSGYILLELLSPESQSLRNRSLRDPSTISQIGIYQM